MCTNQTIMYLLHKCSQLKWSVLLIFISVYQVIGLPIGQDGQQISSSSTPDTDINIPLLTYVVNSFKNVREIGQRAYKRWQVVNCPNLEVAVYGDCFVKSEVTLIAAIAAGSSVLVVLICCLCKRRRRLEEQAYRNYLLEGGSINGQLWENGFKGGPLPSPDPQTENWNWFKERQKRRRKEREERWTREREREIERRRRREKKMKREKG